MNCQFPATYNPFLLLWWMLVGVFGRKICRPYGGGVEQRVTVLNFKFLTFNYHCPYER